MTKHMNPADCRPLCLADCDLGAVWFCPECQVVHVSVHHTTLRFQLEAFHLFSTMLTGAEQRIQAAMETARAPVPATEQDMAHAQPESERTLN